MTPQSPYDPATRSLARERGSVCFTDEGESPRAGDALVLIHGLPGSVRDYRWLESALRAHEGAPPLRVVRLDMPGLGGTAVELAEGKHDVRSRAAFVLDTLDALGIGRAVLVGHSMGGGVALAAAAEAQRRHNNAPRGSREQSGTGEREQCAVVGLGLLASVGTHPHKGYQRMPDPRPAGLLLKVPVLSKLLHQPIYDSFVRSGFPKSTPVSECVQSLRCVAALRFPHLAEAAQELSLRPLPTLVAYADDDPLVEPEVGAQLTELLGAEELRFAEGGHNIQKTQAVELAEGLHGLAARAFGVPKELRQLA
ncbi:MAG: alpha/beta hydrolase [Sandaracinaceae bacterium]|nr:alpha/beta hydrolase [Sandaracinaceae bacterium]